MSDTMCPEAATRVAPARSSPTPKGPTLFFIGGMVKSGTTWLRLLLDAHPAINCQGEGHFFTSLMPRLRSALRDHNKFVNEKNKTIFSGFDGFPLFSERHLKQLLTAAIALILSERGGGAPIIGEKTPDNVLHFPALAAMFPTARFITITRDGRDCAVSAWFHNLRLDEAFVRETFPTFADFAGVFAKDWVRSIEAGEKFAAAAPERGLCLSYEALSRAPHDEFARVLRFLGAGSDPATVAACVEAASFDRLSGGRAPGQEDRSSHFRLGVAGAWRKQFDAPALRAFDAVAGDVLRRVGYEASPIS